VGTPFFHFLVPMLPTRYLTVIKTLRRLLSRPVYSDRCYVC
jgi:hypothetical protein